jgi:hypothetical protein
MKTKHAFWNVGGSAVAVLFMLSISCSSSNGPDEPDLSSPESLRRAPTMAWGTTCEKHEASGCGTSHSDSKTLVCMDGIECSELTKPGAFEDLGGVSCYSYTNYDYKDLHEGPCTDPHPYTCEGRAGTGPCSLCAYQDCCFAISFCEDDPNCLAIDECIGWCKDDNECIGRCLNNADGFAAKTFRKLIQCLGDSCKDECGG